MSLGIKIYHVQDFIRKNEVGNIDTERSLEIIREICTAANFHADSNILIDLRLTTLESIASFDEMTNLTHEFIRLAPTFKNKAAVIIPNEPERIKSAGKLEFCMRINKVRYSFFTDYEKAIDWLAEIKS